VEIPTAKLSKLLRHSDARITSRVYAPLAKKDLRGVVDELSTDRGKVLQMKPAG
jgi:integrase